VFPATFTFFTFIPPASLTFINLLVVVGIQKYAESMLLPLVPAALYRHFSLPSFTPLQNAFEIIFL